MSDLIVVTGIRGFGYHGVLPEERITGQEFIVDLQVTADFSDAVESDDVTSTVNYAELAKIALDAIVGPAFNLIESLADVIAKKCLTINRVQAVCVTVHKPSAPLGVPFDDVKVIRCLP